jgi:hypothetical protein
MNIEFDPKHAHVMGGNCTVGKIAGLLEKLKSFSLIERYEIYSELYRDYWATDAGYVLLPELSKNLNGIEDAIDFELAVVLGSIQISASDDPGLGLFEPIVAPFLKKECLGKTIDLLEQGTHFYGPNLAAEEYESLIAELHSKMGSQTSAAESGDA